MYISLNDFKTILESVKQNNIGIKVKTHTGWSNDFLHIIGFITSVSDQQNKTFGGVVLSNMAETEGIMINNISTITAFELQQSCGTCEANTIYLLMDNKSLKALILH